MPEPSASHTPSRCLFLAGGGVLAALATLEGWVLAALRDAGVLTVGSGNLVHQLQLVHSRRADSPRGSTAWAQRFDAAVLRAMQASDQAALARWQGPAPGADVAVVVSVADHGLPLLDAAGAARAGEPVRHVFDGFQASTRSMRCMQWG